MKVTLEKNITRLLIKACLPTTPKQTESYLETKQTPDPTITEGNHIQLKSSLTLFSEPFVEFWQ